MKTEARVLLRALLFTAGMASVGSCMDQSQSSTVLVPNGVDARDLAWAQRGLTIYLNSYSCLHTNIKLGVGDFSSEQTVLPDGTVKGTLEAASPGEIIIDQRFLDSEFSYPDGVTVHALTHACKSKDPLMLDKKFTWDYGLEVYAVHGFNILVELPNGDKGQFTVIEEGVAEALAFSADSLHNTPDQNYNNVGSLSLALINVSSTPKEVSKMLQSNDLYGFIGLVLLSETPTNEEVIKFANWYQRAWDAVDVVEVQAVLDEIFEYRNNKVGK